MKVSYSLVIPVYNEEQTLAETCRRVTAVLDTLPEESEIILVDDGSRDGSLSLIRSLHESDHRIRYASLSRNFGHQIAVTAGLNFATGDAVIVLDADLQDPPELIPTLIAKWREGYEVVYAQRTARQREGAAKRMFAYLFYRVLRLLTNEEIPTDTGDFCLMDRKVVDVLNSLPERGRYLRGLRAWVGFRQAAVPFERESRYAGDVKYTFRKSLSLAVTGIISFSRVPLRLATYLGFLVAGFALVMVGLVVYWRIFYPTAPLIGYTIITAAIFFLAAVQLLCLGIVGEYLGRVYDEVKGRPIFTIKEIAGLAGDGGLSGGSASRSAVANRI